jgi:EmrB/QacA subfamily drug resistance transporter
LIHPRRVNPWFVLVIVGLAQFMVVLDATVVNVALPSIQHALHFSTGSLQWIVNAYALSFGGFLLLGGRAGDLFGRRRLFVIGITLFSAASLFNGLAWSAPALVVGRTIQGLGGALVSPAALSVLTTTFAEGRDRARALGVWSAVAVGGGAVGLLMGGVLTQLASWEWVFFVNVPVGIATLVLALRFVPESRAAGAAGRMDVLGAVSITGGLMLLVYALVNAQSAGWTSPETLGLFVLSAGLLVAFVALQMRLRHPLIRLALFRRRSLSGANVAMLLAASGMFAMFFFLTIYVQEVLGFDPLRAGLAFLPMTGVIIIGAGIAQAVVGRTGPRLLAGAGLVLAATGLLMLIGIPVDGTYAGNLLPGLLVFSMGMGLTFVPVTLMATAGVGPEDAGFASGLLNTAQQIGGALGLAVLSTLAANSTASSLAGVAAPSALLRTTALVGGFHAAFLGGALMMVSGAAVLAVLVRRRDLAVVRRAQPELEMEAA